MDSWLVGATAISIAFAIAMVWIAVRDHRRRAESNARVELLQALAAEAEPAPVVDDTLVPKLVDVLAVGGREPSTSDVGRGFSPGDLAAKPTPPTRPSGPMADHQFVVTVADQRHHVSFDRRNPA